MPELFDPISVRGITARNRIVMPPLANDWAGDDGHVTDAHVTHYALHAKNEVGTIIVEHCYIDLGGRFSCQQLGISDDAHVRGLARIASAIKEGGAVSSIQINHAAARSSSDIVDDWPVAPSDVSVPGTSVAPRPLEKREIEALIATYADAAERAVRAGFDSVELHGAHGFLLSEFISPYMNQRRDEYGGSFENRMRFPLAVIAAVRERVGDKPLFYRLGADDLTRGGLTIDKGKQVARILEGAGVDVLDVSGGICGATPPYGPEYQGYFVPLAKAIKNSVGVPVIAVGGIKEASFANSVIAEGIADMVAVGRALLEDAEWAVKARKALLG